HREHSELVRPYSSTGDFVRTIDPAEQAAFVDRMEHVDKHVGATKRNPSRAQRSQNTETISVSARPAWVRQVDNSVRRFSFMPRLYCWLTLTKPERECRNQACNMKAVSHDGRFGTGMLALPKGVPFSRFATTPASCGRLPLGLCLGDVTTGC